MVNLELYILLGIKFNNIYRHIETGFIFAMKVIKKANIQA
jgi:hypothetical protein